MVGNESGDSFDLSFRESVGMHRTLGSPWPRHGEWVCGCVSGET